jgi:hypothetical protein
MAESSHDLRTSIPLGILYEHPDWFRPLFSELERRGIPYTPLRLGGEGFDPSETAASHPVIFNRMSPSAWLREGGDGVFFTAQYLEHLQRLGVRVINGLAAWRTEISKAAQLTLLEALGLPYPRARVIHRPQQAARAARGLRFPVVAKPNVGGSGAGIVRFDTPEALERGAAGGELDFGLDGTALIQEFIPPRDGRIVRVEVLGGEFLYAIRVYTPGDQFNLCPADVCQSVDGAPLERSACPVDAPTNDLRVEGYEPPETVKRAVERITGAAGIEIGGVEYLIDDRDGELYYYDVNALSNFVADAPRVVGFDPFQRLVDWLEVELEEVGVRPRSGAGGLPRASGSSLAGAALAPEVTP